ncbi:MAG TPA: hypothetical protein RMI62_15945, partial [Polyangiaceae bacterium LLY-WYZ-15_(1-7)]|nr:hypothetical protein [Polyangiaceae bacterium LLY-WYZ-15_(1-7)]
GGGRDARGLDDHRPNDGLDDGAHDRRGPSDGTHDRAQDGSAEVDAAGRRELARVGDDAAGRGGHRREGGLHDRAPAAGVPDVDPLRGGGGGGAQGEEERSEGGPAHGDGDG